MLTPPTPSFSHIGGAFSLVFSAWENKAVQQNGLPTSLRDVVISPSVCGVFSRHFGFLPCTQILNKKLAKHPDAKYNPTPWRFPGLELGVKGAARQTACSWHCWWEKSPLEGTKEQLFLGILVSSSKLPRRLWKRWAYPPTSSDHVRSAKLLPVGVPPVYNAGWTGGHVGFKKLARVFTPVPGGGI